MNKIRKPKEINTQVGMRVKKAREAAGYTQEGFAEALDMGAQNISDVERGMVGLSISSIKKICGTLSISSDSLIMEDQDDKDLDQLEFLFERIKRLPDKQYKQAMVVFNEVMKVFALQNADKM